MKKFFTIILAFLFGGAVHAQNGSTSKFVSQSNIDFAKTISNASVQLIDVRTPSEYVSGHIPGARNIDVNSSRFDKQAEALDKAKPVAVYCRSGARSKAAARKLVAKGFKVYELDKGIMNWNGKTEK